MSQYSLNIFPLHSQKKYYPKPKKPLNKQFRGFLGYIIEQISLKKYEKNNLSGRSYGQFGR